MNQLYIRIFQEGTEYHSDLSEDWTPEDFGGVVPNIGDFIVHPGVLQGLNRQVPANRDIYEVTSRYFLPATASDQNPRLALLVRIRPGTEKEIELLGS